MKIPKINISDKEYEKNLEYRVVSEKCDENELAVPIKNSDSQKLNRSIVKAILELKREIKRKKTKMDIKVGNIVKTYNLCTGEIKLGQIEHILDKDKSVSCWRSSDELKYEGEKDFIKIEFNTIIWDKDNKRYVFRYWNSGCACFSTVVLDACEPDVALWRMIIPGEKIEKDLP